MNWGRKRENKSTKIEDRRKVKALNTLQKLFCPWKQYIIYCSTKSVNCLQESGKRHHDSHLAAEPPQWTICRLCLIQFNLLEQWSSKACSKESFQVQVSHYVDILCWKSGQKLQYLQQSTKVCEVCKLRCLKYQNSKDVKEITLWLSWPVYMS